jgi:hypothetical protein
MVPVYNSTVGVANRFIIYGFNKVGNEQTKSKMRILGERNLVLVLIRRRSVVDWSGTDREWTPVVKSEQAMRSVDDQS